MTEKQKTEMKNKLHTWANTKKLLKMEAEELAELTQLCKDLNENLQYLPDGGSTQVAKRNIEICKNRINILDNIMQKNNIEKEKIDSVLDKLDPMEQILIKQRYLHNTGWDCISAHLPIAMSIRQIYRLHNDVLSKLWEMLD